MSKLTKPGDENIYGVSGSQCSVRGSDGNMRRMKVFVTTDSVYFPLFLNWLAFYFRLCNSTSSVFIMCLDEESRKLLPRHGLSCAHVFTSGDGKDFMLERTRTVASLLSQGYDVLQSDSDAMWLRNPFHLITQYVNNSEYDIIGSRGKGTTLCMGFTYTIANNRTTQLWETVTHRIETSNASTTREHDQVHFNSIMKSGGGTLEDEHVNTTVDQIDADTFQFHNETLRLVILSYSSIVRFCDTQDQARAVVVHCLAVMRKRPKHIHTKLQLHQYFAEKYGLWILKRDWIKIPFNTNLTNYMSAITIDEAPMGSSSGGLDSKATPLSKKVSSKKKVKSKSGKSHGSHDKHKVGKSSKK
eukprot:CAMPEP_0175006488 /NCGR_PEP_ID=MMETSP0005-20121125/5884_1 /TAXON_ID=420556 /ORGANISM="Ochromonas sp., Strain CCMP1393" /LENGTH=356 /DNA_ID=CAMNT_0016261825 /DNA_START=159 /DNA_END=1229 /DNA_ORIENTATION=+